MYGSKFNILTSFLLASSSITTAAAFSFQNPSSTRASCPSTALHATTSRETFLQQVFGTTAAAVGISAMGGFVNPMVAVAAEEETVKLPSGTSYVILKSGDGPKPNVGELAGIRFRAEVVQTGNKIDDIFDTPEPYYTRVGSGGLLKGVEEVLPSMRVGDRYLITIPTNMAFGPKGRPSSAGKPRIPGDAIIKFEVEMVSLPGREQELIDLIGDE